MKMGKTIVLLCITVLPMQQQGYGRQRGKVPLSRVEMEKAAALASPDAPHWGDSIECLSCHMLHESKGAQLTNVAGNANLCMSCHNPTGRASAKPFTNADRAIPGTSGTSHAWDKPATKPQFGAAPPTNTEMSRRLFNDKIVCSTCHNQHKQTFSPFLRDSNNGNALCKDCHSVRDVPSYRSDANSKGSHPAGVVYPVSDSRFFSSPQNPNLPLIDPDKVECTTCHKPHFASSGDTSNGQGDGYILRDKNDDQLCMDCHTYTAHMGMGCCKCHQPHDPDQNNILLVKETVSTPNSGYKSVVFIQESGVSSFADGNSTYNGICEVCHTQTAYHRNNISGNHTHNAGDNCTVCHKHEKSFIPPPCHECHDQPQDNGDGIPAGGRRAIVGELTGMSHHLQSASLKPDDCRICHDMSKHSQGRVRLKDRDNSAIIYELINRPMDDYTEALKLEPFCLNCHDGDSDTPFADGKISPQVDAGMWQNSAHKKGGSGLKLTCMGKNDEFGCHATGHGSDNIKILNTDNALETLDKFCYKCHTAGKVENLALSGAAVSNDIEEVFMKSEKHNLGTQFTTDGKTFTLQCTSCHNPHIVTGKHWDVASGVSPVTRPDLNADPATNQRAMGNALWGASSGQKMRDFAAQGSGTGGWYYSTARGGTISWDQPAVYQPPKKGSGYNFEFSSSVLPDYPTLCLDCHSQRVSPSNPPVNWGQGISCTDNSVDPPNQRIECGAQHGLNAAGMPNYVSDQGKAGFWGSSGNPDVLFHMNYVTRGRGVGHFMRWPYDSAERTAGINFVLSCTDCHESHGSNAASMLRSTINAYGAGTSNWNTMCNNCHYYYGGQHAGMSCGNASCHEANSIHRIIHTTDSGAGTKLQLTASGNESNYQRPDFTPDIIKAESDIGSNQIQLIFRGGVYTNSNLTGSVNTSDFWYFDVGGNNPKYITNISHSAGASTATVHMSSALTSADLNNDIIASRGKTIWNWYDGGYVNSATGTIPAQAVSAGPWPVTISRKCPTGTVAFQLNESAGSSTASDQNGYFVGSVSNPSVVFPGDGYFHGEESQGTYIEFNSNNDCLISPSSTGYQRELTIEARFRPSVVDLDFTDSDGDSIDDNTRTSTQLRVFERKRTFQLTVMRGDWMTDNVLDRAGKARIIFKFRAAPPYRRDCGADGPGAWMKQVYSDINSYPIVANHWYRVKVVFNSNDSQIPVRIYGDDLGTDGNGAGENWGGFVQIFSSNPNDSGACKWVSQPGDEMAVESQPTIIGDNTVHNDVPGDSGNQLFKGEIDWITWKSFVD